MAKNRLPTASLQQPPLREPIYNPGPFTDPTPIPGYGEVPGFTPDRIAAIGQVANPEPLPLDVGAVIAQMNSVPQPSPMGGGLSPRASQLQGEFQDIRGRGMEAADIEASQKRAALENWMRTGGQSPSGGVTASLRPGAWTADAQAGVDSFVANNPRPSPTTLNRLPGEVPPSMRPSPVAQATGAYVPGGNESFGAIPAVRTGDPFLDDNTNWNQLSKDREIKGKNDAHFTAMNDARLGGIASDRQAADAKRAANLAAQGMTQEQIDMRMHPERFAAPKDPGIAQAQAVDAAERQGRSNLHAIAQKFMRNGLSPAAAYSAAMNVTPTTNPGNLGAVPSLPGLDPMRVIQTSSPGTGMAAAQQSVGTTRANNDLTLGSQRSADTRYGVDSQERVGMANAQNGATQNQNTFIAQLLENALKQSQNQTAQGAVGTEQDNARRDQTMEMIKMLQQQGIHNYPPSHPERQRYDSLWQSMIGSDTGMPRPGDGAALNQAAAGPLSQAMKPPAPQGPVAPPQSQDAMIASNPTMLKQHLDQYPVEQQQRQHVELLIRAGRGNDPIVRDFIINQYRQDDPNLFGWFPDRWVSSYEDAGTASPLQAMMGGPSWTDAAAGYMQQNYGFPTDVTRPHLNQWFNK